MVEAGLSFVRRSFEGGWNYFVANRTATNFDNWVNLGRPAISILGLNPLTGEFGILDSHDTQRIVSYGDKPFVSPLDVHIQLKSGESVILRAFADKKVEGLAWNYWQTSGAPTEIARF